MNRWKIVRDADKVEKCKCASNGDILRDCLFDGGLHSSKVEFYCARRATNSLVRSCKMHFSHDIVVVYWCHKFLLHNSRGEQEEW